jgi:hypothetical protein
VQTCSFHNHLYFVERAFESQTFRRTLNWLNAILFQPAMAHVLAAMSIYSPLLPSETLLHISLGMIEFGHRMLLPFAAEISCHRTLQFGGQALRPPLKSAFKIWPAAKGWMSPDAKPKGTRLMLSYFRALKERRSVGKVFGGIEVDLSDETQRNGSCVWQVHAHIVVETDDPDALARDLRAAYQSSSIYRPVMAKRFDNSIKGISYLIKSHFRRKVFYRSANHQWRNRTLRLAARDEVELAFLLARSGLRSRLLLLGFNSGRGEHMT